MIKLILLLIALLIPYQADGIIVGFSTVTSGGGPVNYIGNSGFESALSGSLTSGNWYGSSNGAGTYGSNTTYADRVNTNDIDPSYVGRVYARVNTFYDEGDCYDGCNANAWASIEQKILKADWDAGTGTLAAKIRPKQVQNNSSNLAYIQINMYDSGNNDITDTSVCSNYVLTMWGSLAGCDTSIAWTPSANSTHNISKDIKTFVQSHFASGKGTSDISYVVIRFIMSSNDSLYNLEYYVDTVEYKNQ